MSSGATPAASLFNPFESLSSSSSSPSPTSSSFSSSSSSSSSVSDLFTAGGSSKLTGSPTLRHSQHSPAHIVPKNSRTFTTPLSNTKQERKEEVQYTLAEIKKGFDAWDLNRDGTITSDEVEKVLISAGFQPSTEEVRQFIHLIQPNDQNRITYPSYAKAYLRKLGLSEDYLNETGSSSENHRSSVTKLKFEHPHDLVVDMTQDLDRKKLQHQHPLPDSEMNS